MKISKGLASSIYYEVKNKYLGLSNCLKSQLDESLNQSTIQQLKKHRISDSYVIFAKSTYYCHIS